MTEAAENRARPDRLHFDDVGAIVTAAIATTFVVSVVYEMAFLAALNLSLGDLPITLADFTKNALSWLPYFALGFGLRLPVGLVDDRLRAQEKPRDPLPPAKGCLGIFVWVLDHGPKVMMAGMIVFILVSVGEIAVSIFAMLVAVGWLWIASWAIRHPGVGGRMSVRHGLAAVFAPAIAILVLGFGWSKGVSSLTAQTTPLASVAIDHHQRSVRVLRLYERGLLALHDGRATFVPWETVDHLDRAVRERFWWGVECEAWRCVVRDERPKPRAQQ